MWRRRVSHTPPFVVVGISIIRRLTPKTRSSQLLTCASYCGRKCTRTRDEKDLRPLDHGPSVGEWATPSNWNGEVSFPTQVTLYEAGTVIIGNEHRFSVCVPSTPPPERPLPLAPPPSEPPMSPVTPPQDSSSPPSDLTLAFAVGGSAAVLVAVLVAVRLATRRRSRKRKMPGAASLESVRKSQMFHAAEAGAPSDRKRAQLAMALQAKGQGLKPRDPADESREEEDSTSQASTPAPAAALQHDDTYWALRWAGRVGTMAS